MSAVAGDLINVAACNKEARVTVTDRVTVTVTVTDI